MYHQASGDFSIPQDNIDDLSAEQRLQWRNHLYARFGKPELADEPDDPTADTSCISGSLIGINASAGKLFIVPTSCGRWDCPHCANRKARKYYARIFSQKPERKITLTCWTKSFETPLDALDRCKYALAKVASIIRRGVYDSQGHEVHRPRVFEYAAVWEIHQNGYPHLHIAQWGSFVPQAYLSELWSRYALSTNVDIRNIIHGTRDNHNWVKYQLKALPLTQSLFAGRRLVTFSRGWTRYKSNDTKDKTTGKTTWHYFHTDPEDIRARLDEFYNNCQTIDQEGDDTFQLDGPLSPDAVERLLWILDGGSPSGWKSLKQDEPPTPQGPPPKADRQLELLSNGWRPS